MKLVIVLFKKIPAGMMEITALIKTDAPDDSFFSSLIMLNFTVTKMTARRFITHELPSV